MNLPRPTIPIAAALALSIGCSVTRTPLVINDRPAPARVEVRYADSAPLVADIPGGERVKLTVRPLEVQHIEVTSEGEQLLSADGQKIRDTRDRLNHFHLDVKAWLIKDNGVWPLTREQLRGYDEKTGERAPPRRAPGRSGEPE